MKARVSAGTEGNADRLLSRLLLILCCVVASVRLASPADPVPEAESNQTNAVAALPEQWTPLFNGTNLSGWYTWLASKGKNVDPQGVIKVQNGVIHILDIPVTGAQQEFGYFATNAEYANYHLRFEYRWGQKRFAPRATAKRDSGLLYHMVGSDVIWPRSMECQIQEGDTGDTFPLNGTRLRAQVESASASPYKYKEGGTFVTANRRVVKNATVDSLTDWNKVEVIVSGSHFVHIVNGKVVNRGNSMQQNSSAGYVALTQGRIAFQVEGAEVLYRNIEIKSLPLPTTSSRVLLFSKTSGFRHSSIPVGVSAIKDLGTQNGFTVDATENAAAFTDANLAQYKALIFLMTTGEVLSDSEQAAMEHFIRAGNGYAGIHSASDTEYNWPWYGDLVGAYFLSHPPGTPQATVRVEDRTHPSTASLPDPWVRRDEWYNFTSNPRARVKVLLTVDESTYQGGTMGDHPIAWYHAYDGGRSWYTAGGHSTGAYSEAAFRQHLLGGIRYAANISTTEPPDRAGWVARASSSTSSGTPDKAIDSDPKTRWSTGISQSIGQYFQVDCGRNRTFNQIVMDSGGESYEADWPRGYEVYVSADGSNWGSPIARGAGTSRFTTITFPTQTARHFRIMLTAGQSGTWWSIHDLTISAGSGGPPVPLPFVDNFEDGNAAGWTSSGGTWQVCQPPNHTREYCNSSTGNSLALAGDSGWKDYSVQGYARRETLEGGVAIVARAQDGTHYYQLELRRDASGDGRWYISKINGTVTTELASGPYSFAAQYYLLRLEVVGSVFTASISKDWGRTFQSLGTANDSSYSTGRVGVRSWGTPARFDDIRVSAR
ncbi:MAG TPA: ThuA domain-containing protein [Bryobacteraceae bacterium]|nr:ThuA domain-containing protein [Bryobacteraceae bacterium]